MAFGKKKAKKSDKKKDTSGGCKLGCKKECKSKKIEKVVAGARYLCPEGGVYVIGTKPEKGEPKLMVQ